MTGAVFDMLPPIDEGGCLVVKYCTVRTANNKMSEARCSGLCDTFAYDG